MERKVGFIHLQGGVREEGVCEDRISAGLGLSLIANFEGFAQEFEDKIQGGNEQAGQPPLLQPFGVLGLAILCKKRERCDQDEKGGRSVRVRVPSRPACVCLKQSADKGLIQA